VTRITDRVPAYDYAAGVNVTIKGETMLLSVMIVCAVAAVLLFAMGAFDDLRDVWVHPEHIRDEDDRHHPRPH